MTSEKKANAAAKAMLTAEEIAAVRKLVSEQEVRGAAQLLGLSRGTVFRILSGLPVHNLTASHLRVRLG